MISRIDTVNLSNMPAKSERIYSTDLSSSDDSLASFLAAIPVGEIDDQWKITHFEKSLLVSIAELRLCCLTPGLDVYLSGCLCQWRFRLP